MTLEEAIKHGEEQLEIFGGEHKEFIRCALDALKREHKGRWKKSDEDEGYVECPFCGHLTNCESREDIARLHFCFWCGAEMEGSEEE